MYEVYAYYERVDSVLKRRCRGSDNCIWSQFYSFEDSSPALFPNSARAAGL